jgi:hypothetical protein
MAVASCRTSRAHTCQLQKRFSNAHGARLVYFNGIDNHGLVKLPYQPRAHLPIPS